jgi:acyl-CoA synthetase (AMP-forming)/AMP-acid ligase II
MIFRSPHPDVAIPDLPLHAFVLQGAGERAEKAALIDGPTGRTLTYGQLAAGARLIAAGLAGRGFAKGDVFALYSPNIPEYAVALLAVSTLGGITTTVNPLYTPGELAYQLNDTGATFLLTIPQFMDKAVEAARGTAVREIFVFGEAEGATPFGSLLQSGGQLPEVQIDPITDVAIIPYSSGTTGLPKGVMLTHRNLVANMCQIERAVSAGEDDCTIAVLPFYHVYGLTAIMCSSVYRGGKLVTMPRFDLEQFLQLMQRYEVTIAPIVPPIVVALAKHPIVDQYRLPKLRWVNSGAAPLGDDVQAACAQRLGCLVVQGYGMTETTVATHTTPLDRPRSGSAGLLLPNTECKIVDLPTGEALGPGEQGEVCVRGPQIMRGYLHHTAATDAMIDAEGWLHTGDVGRVDEDGYLYVTDRVKELIKYKGMQVAPAELEALLLTHPAVADAAVIPLPDEEAGEVPKAFVVLKAPVTEQEIMAYVAGRVAPHKKVRQVEFVEQIPKALSGKILRRVLVEQERAKVASRAVQG